MSTVTVEDIVRRIDKFAPPVLAEDWDPIGLSFGSLTQPVKKIMIALDIDADTIQEAKEQQIDLIFTHHPAIFRSQKTLNAMDQRRKEYIELIQAGIAVYSAHTNIDAAENGMSDWLADQLGLPKERQIVYTSYQMPYKKIAVYVPKENADQVRKAMHKAGAGEVGQYNDVSYHLDGWGRFTPQPGADPAEGQINQETVVEEVRIEMMFPATIQQTVISAIQSSHPYEEPVFDVFTLENAQKAFGYGRAAEVNQTTEEMIHTVKKAFKLDGLKYGSVSTKKVHHKAAVFGGAGEKYYLDAKKQGATLFITGDISYHGAQDMLRDGIAFIDAGHYIESIFVEKMAEVMNQWKQEEGWTVEVYQAQAQKDVFKFS